MQKNLTKREVNKAQNKERFLEAAERLFLEKGFENTSIEDVTKDAGLTKRTLYQYFTSKEDLFYAVMVKGAMQLTNVYEEAFRQGRDTLEKIRLANLAYYRFYQEYPGMFKLMNYQPANVQNSAQSPHLQEIMLYQATRMRHFMELVEEGSNDGSIRAGLDTRKAVFFAFFAAFSLLHTVSTTDSGVWAMMDLEEDDFLRFSLNLISGALQP